MPDFTAELDQQIESRIVDYLREHSPAKKFDVLEVAGRIVPDPLAEHTVIENQKARGLHQGRRKPSLSVGRRQVAATVLDRMARSGVVWEEGSGKNPSYALSSAPPGAASSSGPAAQVGSSRTVVLSGVFGAVTIETTGALQGRLTNSDYVAIHQIIVEALARK